MDAWERRLATRDTNRKSRPFEWGLDWLESIALPGFGAQPNGDGAAWLDRFAGAAREHSSCFYSYNTPTDYALDGRHLTFTTAAPCPYPENNTVHADFFPAPGDRAVVVMPQWNADAEGHAGLCRLLNRFGITALRMSLAYHDRRMPEGLERADYHVSSNVGRTLHAGRQSVVDARACLDWLEQRGYRRLGVQGTSLGSCIAFITAAHDPRVRAGAFNHVSMNFGDVVWTGLSTEHVRDSFAAVITQDQLRHYWSPISPASYFGLMERRALRSLLIWARHDSTFLPVFSRQVIEAFRERRLPHEVFTLPCGHYTTGQFPFNVMDGLVMCRFLASNL
jgi:hypothetical protein